MLLVLLVLCPWSCRGGFLLPHSGHRARHPHPSHETIMSWCSWSLCLFIVLNLVFEFECVLCSWCVLFISVLAFCVFVLFLIVLFVLVVGALSCVRVLCYMIGVVCVVCSLSLICFLMQWKTKNTNIIVWVSVVVLDFVFKFQRSNEKQKNTGTEQRTRPIVANKNTEDTTHTNSQEQEQQEQHYMSSICLFCSLLVVVSWSCCLFLIWFSVLDGGIMFYVLFLCIYHCLCLFFVLCHWSGFLSHQTN